MSPCPIPVILIKWCMDHNLRILGRVWRQRKGKDIAWESPSLPSVENQSSTIMITPHPALKPFIHSFNEFKCLLNTYNVSDSIRGDWHSRVATPFSIQVTLEKTGNSSGFNFLICKGSIEERTDPWKTERSMCLEYKAWSREDW